MGKTCDLILSLTLVHIKHFSFHITDFILKKFNGYIDNVGYLLSKEEIFADSSRV